MSYWKAVFLGFLQGVAEFLPISSSGHLLVFRNLLNLGDIPLLFDIFLHFATLIVVIFVFRNTIINLIKSLIFYIKGERDNLTMSNMKIVGLMIISTFITGVLGIFISSYSDSFTPAVASILFIVTGFILLFSRGKNNNVKHNIKQGIIIGIAQGIGVFPGISRSGITISAARMAGMDRKTAGEYSFIISIPAIVGALLLDLKDAENLFSAVSPSVLAVAFITTMIVGYVSLNLLLSLLKSEKLHYFSFYLFVIGISGLVLFL